MEEQVYINEQFKQELQNLGCSYVDYITVYKKEGDRIYFRANQCKFHLTKKEFAEVQKSTD